MMFSVDSNAEEKEEIDVTDEEKGDDDGVIWFMKTSRSMFLRFGTMLLLCYKFR